MTRNVLTIALGALALATGLATAVVQSENRARAIALDALREECTMIEATTGVWEAAILAADHAPRPLAEADAPAHAGREARP